MKKKCSGRPRRSIERAKIIKEAFHNCSKMSIRTASLELNIPKIFIHPILREELSYMTQGQNKDESSCIMSFLHVCGDCPTFVAIMENDIT